MRYLIAVLCLLLVPDVPVLAQSAGSDVPAFVLAAVPQAQPVGTGTMTYMVWDVYDAELMAPDGHYSPDQPFALQLVYKRHVDGSLIADSSAGEMKRQGFRNETKLDEWHKQMSALFPDVEAQTILTGIYRPGQPTCFFREETPIGCIKDPAFGTVFFNIWLAPNTRAPDLRKALLGQS